MKTVSAKVVSSKPVSLSKAARILSKFASSDNGASPAFAAYLKRTSASFDELVQLRKELKGSGSDSKGKKKHVPDTEETVNCVFKQPSQDVSEKKTHTLDKRNEVEARERVGEGSVGVKMEKQNSEGNVGRSPGYVASDEKIKKKKREGGENEQSNDRDQMHGDHGAMDVNGIENEVESVDGSKETKKKKKKKKKKEKGQMEESDGGVKIEKQEQSGPLSQDDGGDAGDVLDNGVGDRKKHKKNKKGKEDSESSGIGNDVKTDKSDDANEMSEVKTEDSEGKKKQKRKKRNQEGEEREDESKAEIEEADKKESKKRKHKESDNGGMDDSEERHKSKKKKSR